MLQILVWDTGGEKFWFYETYVTLSSPALPLEFGDRNVYKYQLCVVCWGFGMEINIEKSGLKGYIKALKWLMRDNKNASKFYSYILKGGKSFTADNVRQMTTTELKKVCFKPKEKSCFYNSQTIALFSDFDYYEGWGTTELGIPFEHAWNIKGDKVVDVTWKNGKMYFGVKIPKDFIRKFWLDNDMSDTLLARYWDSRNKRVD